MPPSSTAIAVPLPLKGKAFLIYPISLPLHRVKNNIKNFAPVEIFLENENTYTYER